jgi:hypothetical protein
MVGFEQGADRVEQAGFRSCVEIEQDVPGRQQLGDLTHRQLGVVARMVTIVGAEIAIRRPGGL